MINFNGTTVNHLKFLFGHNQFLNNQQNISDFSTETIDATDQSKEIVVQNSESNIQDHISDDNID